MYQLSRKLIMFCIDNNYILVCSQMFLMCVRNSYVVSSFEYSAMPWSLSVLAT